VDHTQAGSSDSAHFPILVYISSNADFKTAANGGYIQNTTTLNGQTIPADLIVTTDAACQNQVTAWEVASYSAGTGTLELWVNQGTLSHTVNTVFNICIDNPAVTTYQSTATSVWDSNYLGVYHLANGSTLSPNDSISKANNGATPGAGVTATTGQIDGGVAISGASTAYLNASGLSFPTGSAITVSFWNNAANSTSGSAFTLNNCRRVVRLQPDPGTRALQQYSLLGLRRSGISGQDQHQLHFV
jgi:hypothetical protein